MPAPPSLGLLFNILNCIFCHMQLQLVIFDFEEEGTGTELKRRPSEGGTGIHLR